MKTNLPGKMTRRSFLQSGAGAAAAMTLRPFEATAKTHDYHFVAAPGRSRLLGDKYPDTGVWAYSGSVPGPAIRMRQGDRLRVAVENRLKEETTVHWHGLRIPNPMDGVPYLTQKPIAPGETFIYEFDVPDAGTYWYHPHQHSSEQVGRGLYGPLIVEEPDPIRVDRDLTWVLDDWRLKRDAQISDDFGGMMDASHGGRVGNFVSINGKAQEPFQVRKGERIRLRLVNAANARIFALEFAGHTPTVISLDGQPVAPHEPEGGLIVLGPAMRADIVLDFTGATGSRFPVTDKFYRRTEYALVEIAYADAVLRERVPDWPMTLPVNPLPDPDLTNAARHEVTFTGGMMGGTVMQEMDGRMGQGMMGGMMNMMHSGKIWFINGLAAEGPVMAPMLTLARGRSYVIAMTNMTAWPHPIHLHGHSFRVISRNGKPTRHREWQDTVLMAPREKVEIALVADNPGDWMFHCHILEHQAAGMMGVIRVA